MNSSEQCCADIDDDAAGETTAKYGPTCTWTRPTMAQLEEFGIFPDPDRRTHAH